MTCRRKSHKTKFSDRFVTNLYDTVKQNAPNTLKWIKGGVAKEVLGTWVSESFAGRLLDGRH